MRHASDVFGMQVSDDDLAEPPYLLYERCDHAVADCLVSGMRRAGVDHDHVVSADQITVGVSRGRERWRAKRAEEYAVTELDSTFQMVALLLRYAEQTLGEILDAFGQRLDRGEDRCDYHTIAVNP